MTEPTLMEDMRLLQQAIEYPSPSSADPYSEPICILHPENAVSILASLRKLAAIEAQPVPVPVEPEWVIQSRKSKKLGFSGDYSHLDYIDALNLALQAAQQEAIREGKLREETADQLVSVINRAEKAEAALQAGMESAGTGE